MMVLFSGRQMTFCVYDRKSVDGDNDDSDSNGDNFDEEITKKNKQKTILGLFSKNIPILGTYTW